MSSAILNQVFAELTACVKMEGGLHNDFLAIVQRDLERFFDETKLLQNQLTWQGRTILCLTVISASLAIAGVLIPKAGATSPAARAADVRMTANGARDIFSKQLKWLGERLKDNDFLRETCKAGSTLFGDGLLRFTDVSYRSKTTLTEAERTKIQQILLSDGQGGKSNCSALIQQLNQAALNIIQSKARAG